MDIDKAELAQKYYNLSPMLCFFCQVLGASQICRNCRGRDLMVSEFTTIDFRSHSWRGVVDTALCDKVCQRQVPTVVLLVFGFPPPIYLTTMR
jgi:hypothetical protein